MASRRLAGAGSVTVGTAGPLKCHARHRWFAAPTSDPHTAISRATYREARAGAMIPRRFTRILIGTALLGIAALTITALKLAMPGSGAAESRNTSTTASTPTASNATRLHGS